MKKLFGTDGMRGEAGRFPLDPATAQMVGASLAQNLAQAIHATEGKRRAPRIITGRDTRESGVWLDRAFTEGARGAGAVCEQAGVITTPGVAYLAQTLGLDAGIVISASHNPFQDNGIKIFARDGRKLDERIERLIEADIYEQRKERGSAAEVSQAENFLGENFTQSSENRERSSALRAQYLDYLADEIAAEVSLDNLHLVVDCANGAATDFAPALFRRLGARVTTMGDAPNGRNINLDCGSLHLEGLQARVLAEKADFGVAFDGDADRALFVDAGGNTIDGDATLWIMAQAFAAEEKLAGETIVATVMSNIGLELACRTRGWNLVRTDVGDKYVLDKLIETGASLGGEQSGHIIFPHESYVGDGLRTTIHVLRTMVNRRLPIAELVEGFMRYPQILVNVHVREKIPFDQIPAVKLRAREIETQLEGTGRLLLRYSGTELLARVMIEGRDAREIESLANSLAETIKSEIG
jgi:phosphoglucosamine mutase